MKAVYSVRMSAERGKGGSGYTLLGKDSVSIKLAMQRGGHKNIEARDLFFYFDLILLFLVKQFQFSHIKKK